MPNGSTPAPRLDALGGRRRPTVVIDSSAVIEELASGPNERTHRLDALRNGEPGPFGYGFDDHLTIAVVGAASRDRNILRLVTDWTVGDPGFIFTGGVLRVSRYFRHPIDFLVHGKTFDDYGYGADAGEKLLVGADGLEDWFAIATHVKRAWDDVDKD